MLQIVVKTVIRMAFRKIIAEICTVICTDLYEKCQYFVDITYFLNPLISSMFNCQAIISRKLDNMLRKIHTNIRKSVDNTHQKERYQLFDKLALSILKSFFYPLYSLNHLTNIKIPKYYQHYLPMICIAHAMLHNTSPSH